MDYLVTFGGIHAFLLLENHGWYSWNLVKKNWNLSGDRLGPRASAPVSAPRFALRSDLRSGPRAQPVAREVSIFFYQVSWNHLWFQAIKTRETTKSDQIIHETRSQKKKNARFLFKTTTVWFQFISFFISWNHQYPPGLNLFFIEFHETTNGFKF